MKEKDIRKQETLNRYLQLVREDAETFFTSGDFVSVSCPACGNSDDSFEFKKSGFTYVSCKNCLTLFANPRPSFENLKRFYIDSPSTTFWVNDFFKPVAEARREMIFRPRAEYVYKKFPEKAKGIIGDIGTGFGIFLEELTKFWPTAKLIAIEPSTEQAEICRNKGLAVKCCALEELEGIEGLKEQFHLLTAFELFEHLFNPIDFLQSVRRLLKPGGHFLMTTLNGQGFDTQLLWEQSKSISPPHHLNFFNPQSVSLLLERSDFEVVEVSTPGKLDWDIVEGMIKEGLHLGRFWEFLAHQKNSESKQELQNWISKNKMSSHMRILARKK